MRKKDGNKTKHKIIRFCTNKDIIRVYRNKEIKDYQSQDLYIELNIKEDLNSKRISIDFRKSHLTSIRYSAKKKEINSEIWILFILNEEICKGLAELNGIPSNNKDISKNSKFSQCCI